MIIRKEWEYWTDADEQRREEVDKKRDALLAEYNKEAELAHSQGKQWKASADLTKRNDALMEEALQVYRAVEKRYIASRSRKELLEDIKEILTAVDKQDYLDHVDEGKRTRILLMSTSAPFTEIRKETELAEENYTNCWYFLYDLVSLQARALGDNADTVSYIRALIDKKASKWYVDKRPALLPVAHSKATDVLAYMSNKDAKLDKITGDATINKFGVEVVVRRLDELHVKLGPSTDKLCSYGLAVFTQTNDFENSTEENIQRRVEFPLREYVSKAGWDIEEHEVETPEEAKQEKKRAKMELDNARKAVQKDLKTALAITFTKWQERIKGKPVDFTSTTLLTSVGIENNGETIVMTFSPEIAKILLECKLINQYPAKLLSLDNRKGNAYRIGRKMVDHYNMYNNQERGTHNKLSIPTLIGVTDLPSYEEVLKADKRAHWDRRIKEPLENALETLVQEGVLKDWKYTHAKGIDLTEDEAHSIDSYEEYAKLYVQFTPADTKYTAGKIKARREARAKAQDKKQQQKPDPGNRKKNKPTAT